MPSPPREGSEEVRDVGGGGRSGGGGGGGFTYPKDECFIESYHGEADNGLRKSKTQFEIWLQNQREEGKNLWDPFASEQEWVFVELCPESGSTLL